MPNDEADLRKQVDELKAENERLRKQLADTRAQRAEYMKYITEILPPIELPSEEEMAEQMKHLVPADQVLKEIREARKGK
jgi:chromosome segregation ATPase